MFEEGDYVWLYDPKPKKNMSPKLDGNKWTWPCVVIKRISYCVYVVREPKGRKGRVINVDRLAPYARRDQQRFPPTSAEVAADDVLPDPQAAASEDDDNHVYNMDAEDTHDVVQEDPGDITGTPIAGDTAVDDNVADATGGADFDDARNGFREPPTTTRRAQRTHRRPTRLDDYDE
jgi:hypothetical protein